MYGTSVLLFGTNTFKAAVYGTANLSKTIQYGTASALPFILPYVTLLHCRLSDLISFNFTSSPFNSPPITLLQFTSIPFTLLHFHSIHLTSLHPSSVHLTSPYLASPQYSSPHLIDDHHTTLQNMCNTPFIFTSLYSI